MENGRREKERGRSMCKSRKVSSSCDAVAERDVRR